MQLSRTDGIQEKKGCNGDAKKKDNSVFDNLR